MNKPRKPWRCSYVGSCKPPKPRCKRCMHATFRGQATIRGKRYRWFLRPYYGVQWERSGKANWHPSRKHPVWKAVVKWIDRLLR